MNFNKHSAFEGMHAFLGASKYHWINYDEDKLVMTYNKHMPKGKKNGSDEPIRSARPALTPEGRESQMIAMAMDLAEKQLREGTASSQVISHFLKLGSTKERIEKEIRLEEKKLIEAKTENLQSAKRMEELYNKAIKAFRIYSGESEGDEDEEY